MKRWNKIITTKHVTMVLIPVITIALSLSIWFEATAVPQTDSLVQVTFIINGLVALIALEVDIYRHPFSFTQIHWLFFLTFLVMAPWSQYLSDYRPWGYHWSREGFLLGNELLFGWAALFVIVSVVPWSHLWKFARGRRVANSVSHKKYIAIPTAAEHKREEAEKKSMVSNFSYVSYAVLLVLSLACFVMLGMVAGFGNLFSKATIGIDGNGTGQLVIGVVFRAIPIFAFVIVCLAFKNKRLRWWMLVPLGLLMILTSFPTALARAVAAATYGGLLLIFVPVLRKKNGLFTTILFAGLIVVFPAINVFRKVSLSLCTGLNALADTIVSIPQGFNFEDFDAYSMFMRAIDYVQAYGSTRGLELVSSVLFFVPRSLWPGKLYGSGTMIGEAANLPWTRLSAPLPGEGMMNFGFAGVFLFAIITAAICRVLDSRYHSGRSASLRVFYPFGMIFFFVVMRGELMSALSVTVGYAAIFYVLVGICWVTELLVKWASKDNIKANHGKHAQDSK